MLLKLNLTMEQSSVQQHASMLIIIIASLALIVFGWLNTSQISVNTIALPLVKNCKLNQQACQSVLPTGEKVSFEISPKNPTPKDILKLSVQIDDKVADAVRIKFNGKTMNMGFLEYSLKKQTTSSFKTINYAGKGSLSICVLGKMEWVITVSMLFGNTLYDIPFEMDTFYTP